MKKHIYSFLFAALFFSSAKMGAQALNFSFGQQPLCWTPGGTSQTMSVTSSPTGAVSYSWFASSGTCSNGAAGATTAVNLGTCCGVYSVTCSAYNSSNALLSTLTQTMSITCPNWLSLTTSPSNGILCAGNAGTISAGGAVTYTWSIASTNNSIVVSPSVSTCYSVAATDAQGCTLMTTACFSVATGPVLSVGPSTSICQGQTVAISCGGAMTYTWMSPGPPTFSFSGASPIVSPNANSVYTVMGSNGTCTSTGTLAVIVNPNPTITISGTNTVCQGSSATLTSSGANSYMWSNTATSPTTIVTPTISTCYTVTGTDATTGCSGSATTCISIQSTSMSISPVTQTVCRGSSANMSVTGNAIVYTWNTSATTSSINVLPYSTTSYTVSGTGSNGCTGMDVATVVVDSTCADVWPGDANSDGVVNNTDVFEIGLAYNNTGTARSPGGNTYSSQFANAWTGYVSTGKNKCHADCNGDGTINNGDTVAIFNNFLLTHSFKPSETSSVNGDINLVSTTQGPLALDGMWNKFDIMLGSSTNVMNQLYGVSFDINYDNSLINTNSAYIIYTGSFLNASSQNVQFRKTDFGNGKVYAASVRVDGSNVNGFGKIGEFWFFVKSGTEGSTLNLSVSNSTAVDKTGQTHSLTGSSSALSITSIVDFIGLKELNAFEHAVQFFPNPASNQLTLQSSMNALINYSVSDIAGREITNGSFSSSKNLDVSGFSAGTYFVRLQSGSLTAYKKLVIEK